MTRVAVLGAGSWGTAFAMVLADAGNDVTIWARRPELAEALNVKHENPDYLPGIALPQNIEADHEPERVLDGAGLVVLAVPSQQLRANLGPWAPLVPPEALYVSLMKGVELSTLKRMSEVICEVSGADSERVAVVSGPNLAKEIAQRQPAASVIACENEDFAARVQAACHTPYFRPYTNTDVIGTELGGAAKNVIAIAVGMAQGMGLGDNTKASIITRGLAEVIRLGAVLGADPYTFSGLAGVGDLVATCLSPLSRNRTFGERLGRGESAEEIVASTRQVAEGAKSCQSILELASRHDVEAPIIEHVTAVVLHQISPSEALRSLMSRSAKPERRGY